VRMAVGWDLLGFVSSGISSVEPWCSAAIQLVC
jgi:hypothetical protein